MIALCAKILAMGLLGYPVIPAIVLIPLIAVNATVCAVKLLHAADAAH